jgi:hypothetical protein
MRQEGLFAAQEAVLEAAEAAERKRLFGWTKERGKHYELGHPWCDPDAYPSTDDLLARAESFGKNGDHHSYLHGWSSAETPRAKTQRDKLYADAWAALKCEADLYRRYKELGEAAIDREGYDFEHCYHEDAHEALRNGLAFAYNHIVYQKRLIAAAIIRWPELASADGS